MQRDRKIILFSQVLETQWRIMSMLVTFGHDMKQVKQSFEYLKVKYNKQLPLGVYTSLAAKTLGHYNFTKLL